MVNTCFPKLKCYQKFYSKVKRVNKVKIHFTRKLKLHLKQNRKLNFSHTYMFASRIIFWLVKLLCKGAVLLT